MQYIEASVIGVRSAVITLKRRATPLRFVLIPMVHVAEPDFYREALGGIHAERQNEATKVAVVFGAAHIPAVVDYLTATFRYYVENAVWLTVAHAPD
jgi:hypothetical protein